ncbi:MAG: tetratricopeptide repeat protein [Omnitrophica WOR_2 bacterium]|jgi:TolA-binding protein
MTNLTKPIALVLLSIAILFTACTSKREKAAKAISVQEKELQKENARPEKAKLDALLASYISFADNFPKDTMAPQYLYHAVNLCMGTGDGNKAMELIDRTINQYPNSPKLPETIFLKAYVYENLLGDYGKAASVYRDFVSRFPDNELADDARTAIENLGKTPEEMIKEFEAKNQK